MRTYILFIFLLVLTGFLIGCSEKQDNLMTGQVIKGRVAIDSGNSGAVESVLIQVYNKSVIPASVNVEKGTDIELTVLSHKGKISFSVDNYVDEEEVAEKSQFLFRADRTGSFLFYVDGKDAGVIRVD
jgi:hypothetical protein